MGNWNLHIVGKDLEADLEKVVGDFISAIEGIGHQLMGATLTTDLGQKTITVTPAPAPPAAEEPPATPDPTVPADLPVVTAVTPDDVPPADPATAPV